MTRLRAICVWHATACLLLGAFATSSTSAAGSGDAQLATVAGEARQVIAVINWFYVRRRTCPQPSRPGELAALERELGDGFSATQRDWFVEIRGISMTGSWLYYTSARYPDRCTLWRELGQNATLIWRRHDGGKWTFEPGDGGPERPLKLAHLPARMGDR